MEFHFKRKGNPLGNRLKNERKEKLRPPRKLISEMNIFKIVIKIVKKNEEKKERQCTVKHFDLHIN